MKPTRPVLAESDHEHFLKFGYVVMKNAVAPETVGNIVRYLDSEPADSKRAIYPLLESCVSPQIHHAIGELFGSRYPFEKHCRVADIPRPHETDLKWQPIGLHTDDCAPTLMPSSWALALFVFLTPIASREGALLCFPGSPIRFRRVLELSANVLKDTEILAAEAGAPRELHAQPGDAALVHHLFGHSGSPNTNSTRTRHMLMGRFHPEQRIVPGNKPLPEMSTIEKANSSRFLDGRDTALADSVRPQTIGTKLTQSLSVGFAMEGGIRAAVPVRHEGASHLLFVEAQRPSHVARSSTFNWSSWNAEEPCKLPGDHPILSLNLFRRSKELVLLINYATEPAQSEIFVGNDLVNWTRVGKLMEHRHAVAHFSTMGCGFMDKTGCAIFSTSASNQLMARYGERWQDIEDSNNKTLVASFSRDLVVEDLYIDRVCGDHHFARIVADGGETKSRRVTLHYSLLDSLDDPNVELRPLKFASGSSPRHLRVYDRARNYWLVTYIREHRGDERIFWGCIDWEKPVVSLDEFGTAKAFEQALCIVGMK